MRYRALTIAFLIGLAVPAAAQGPFAAISGGATVGDLYGGAVNTDSRWGGTAGIAFGIRNWNYQVTSLEVNWVQKGGEGTKLDYIEIPLLVGAVTRNSMGVGARFYTGIGLAFPIGCSSDAVLLDCDLKKSTEWSWPLGLQFGRWTGPDRFVALDVRYSLALSDAFDTSIAYNRSWQFRLIIGRPVR
jgi:hypothetical protein